MKLSDFDGRHTTNSTENVFAGRHRLYLLTQNNPENYGLDIDSITQKLTEPFENGVITYWAAINERSIEINPDIGKHTPHLHIMVYFADAQRFSYLHKLFPNAGIFPCKANPPSVYKYIKKDIDGAWYKTNPEKIKEKLPENEAQFVEHGIMPQGSAKKIKATADIVIDAIKNGYSNADLLAVDPALYRSISHIDKARTTILSEEFLHKFRNVEVIYIYGETGTGKTRHVMQTHNYNAYVIDNYDNMWDTYEQQDVIFFDEFRNQPPLSMMLRYMDGNPCKLPARYADKVACYSTVYIASNWTLDQQYSYADDVDKQAFLRRISKKMLFLPDGKIVTYIKNGNKWIEQSDENTTPNLQKEVLYNV